MQIFIDSADIKEIEEAMSYGAIDGVTTNPSLLAKSSNDILKTVKVICKIVTGPVSVEASATDYDGMLRQGNKILDMADNVVLKLPITWSGLKACKHFYEQGRDVNMTLCFSPLQALLAAKAGAMYVSPFIGRLDDIGQDGQELISDIRMVFDNYPQYGTQILSASIRHTQHVLMSAMAGADVATIPLSALKQLINHPLTDKGLDKFLEDWNKSGLSI
jgi:transaldolase